ncbi:MAG: phosphatase PAP2 family protein [Pseudomonadota bacterium]
MARPASIGLSRQLPSLPPGARACLGALAGLALLEWAWAGAAGIGFGNLHRVGLMALALGVIAYVAAARVRTRLGARIARVAAAYALWVLLTASGAILTYLCAHSRVPLCDAALLRIDQALGFDWPAWYSYVAAHRSLHWVLAVAYASGGYQISAAIIYLASLEDTRPGLEFWWTSLLSAVLTALVSGIFPALGSFAYFHIAQAQAVHLPHLLALRDGSVALFNIDQMEGIVTMPSYHTVTALLLIYVFRHQRHLRLPVLVLNVLMLASTPSMGGHYVADMLGGLAVTAVSIWLVRRGLRWRARVWAGARWSALAPGQVLD